MTRDPEPPDGSPIGDRPVVVVGAGLAGSQTCRELRSAGYAGPLVLVGAEPDAPYDRPPLSKGAVTAATGDLGFDAAELNVDFRPGVAVTALHGASRAGDGELAVELDADDPLTAAAVVVASGAAPIVPDAWDLGPRVVTLRTRADAIELDRLLMQELRPGDRLAIFGGSWIGLEVATRAAAAGLAVAVVEKASWLLPQLPGEIGRQVRRWCDDAGVEVHLGLPVSAVSGGAAGDGPVTYQRGEDMDRADAALVALGVRPATDWLHGTELTMSPRNGALRVDAGLRSADPRVVGVGDAIERWSPRYSAWLPAGHWQDAMDEPKVAAASVLAALHPTPGAASPAYDAVPYFWSEMFGHMLQWTGYQPDPLAARMLLRGDPATQESWSVCWLDDDARLTAVLACNRPRDAVAARKLQAADPAGAPRMDLDALADPDRALAKAVASSPGTEV